MQKSTNLNPDSSQTVKPHWTVLTKHADVLLCVANDRDIRLWEIGKAIGVTERAAHRIVGELVDSGYLSREKSGRRNRYAIEADLPVPDSLVRSLTIGELLDVLAAGGSPDAPATPST